MQSTPISYNVVAASPGVYTLNQSGSGPGAVLNQNGITVNGPATPAPRGSVISVYATGEGQTNPVGVDGLVIPPLLSALKRPVLAVTNRRASQTPSALGALTCSPTLAFAVSDLLRTIATDSHGAPSPSVAVRSIKEE